jgi:UDP-3-O-[3-hydroxymyristoyl] glucosamine N-acyltransferase
MALRLAQIAVRFGCELRGDPDVLIDGVASLDGAGRGQIAFLANARYLRHLASTRAAAVILDAKSAPQCPTAALVVANPYATYARIAQELHPAPAFEAGCHPSAVIAADAQIDPTSHVAAGCFIGAGVVIGPACYLGPGTVVLEGVSMGAGSRCVARVTLCAGVRIGRRVLLAPGVVIGADGFGHAPDVDGYVKIPQLGSVVVGDDVEVGANSTIDRGTIGDTEIGAGVKIDNLVQIGHNVRIGEHTVLAAGVGISGSVTIGRRCVFAGHSGAVGHIEICDGVVVTGKGMVTASIHTPGVYSGQLHADQDRRFKRNSAHFGKLDDLVRRLRKLEQAAGRGAGEDQHD